MEQRKLNSDFTFDTEGRTVEGMAVVFDSPSEDLGWTEVIHRGAITNETIEKSDVFAKFNHQDDKVLARSKNGKGSLLLEVDDNGLRYMFEAPKTATGDELLEYLQRGDISSSSFAFSINRKDADAEKNIIPDSRFTFVRSNFRYLKNFLKYSFTMYHQYFSQLTKLQVVVKDLLK